MRPNLHIFGIQGSGKDTQAARLAEHYGLAHISSGELFRARSEVNDDLGKHLRADLQAGSLMPDMLLYKLLQEKLAEVSTGIVAAGVIRTLTQYNYLEKKWTEFDFEQPFGIELVIDDAIARERALKRQRSDDTNEALERRFAAYHSHTEPVIEQLRAHRRLVSVNGNQDIDAVFSEIISKVPPIHGSH